MIHRLLALTLLASLFVAQPAFAQDEKPASAEADAKPAKKARGKAGKKAKPPAEPVAAPAPAPAAAPAPEPSTDIENEMPPADPPRAVRVVVEEKPPEGGIKDISEKRRPFAITLAAYVPWWLAVGIGFKAGFEIPIMHNGFIPSINDSFSLEPSFALDYGTWYGAALYDDIHVLRYTPAVSALWSFYFKPNLRAYAAVSLGYTIVTQTDRDDVELGSYFYHEVAVGGFWDFAPHWSLRGEIGYMGLRAGVAYLL